MGLTTDTYRKPFYFRFPEKSFCRTADFITVPIPEAIEGYYPEFHGKIRVIPQGFKFELPGPLVDSPLHKCPTFAYSGAFIPGLRDPRPLLDYLSTVQIPFRFICFTRQAGLILPYKDKFGERLEIREFIPRNELLRTLAEMDFVVNLENRVAMQSPSKLIDYAIANRPILSVDPLELPYAKINEFLEGNYQRRLVIPDLERYQIQNVACEFISLTLDEQKQPAHHSPIANPTLT